MSVGALTDGLLSGWGAVLCWGIQVFEGTSIKNLYVPEGSADAYREAEGWSLFEHIEEREF